MLRDLHRHAEGPVSDMLRNHRTRARVINYWRQGADVLTVSLPTTPSEKTRKNGPLQPGDATWFPLIL
jgi:hypothetical protein